MNIESIIESISILGEFLSKKVKFLLQSGEIFFKWVLVEYLFDYDP